MFSKILRRIKSLPKLFLLDASERQFVNNELNLTVTTQLAKKAPLLQIPDNYYYTAHFLLSAKQISGIKSGLWPFFILPLPHTTGYKYLIQLFATKLEYFLKYQRWKKIYRSVGVRKFHSLSSFNPFIKISSHISAKKILKNTTTKSELLTLAINGVEMGDLVYDTYLRFTTSPTVDLNDRRLRYILRKAIEAQIVLQKKHKKYGFDLYLTSYSTYTQHGIPVRYLLKNKVDVYSDGCRMNYFKKLSSADTLHTPDYTQYKKSWVQKYKSHNNLQIAKQQIEKRFNGGVDEITSYMKKSAYEESSEELDLHGIDGVMFLHDFVDSPHIYHSMIFTDFWDWSVSTLKFARKNNIKLAIKPHPNQVPESIQFSQELKDLFDDFLWLDPSTSNNSIFASGIQFGLSVYGTVLYELAYHNIIPIAAGDHPAVKFNIAHTPTNQKDYYDFIEHASSLTLAENIEEEILAFYYMHACVYHDDLNALGRKYCLKELDPNSSKSLIDVISRLKKME